MALICCSGCGCPVKSSEKACPFCGTRLDARARPSRGPAAAVMGLAAAVTVGVSAGACGSSVETEGSGGAGGTSAMESTTFVAAYGPPPTFCGESADVRAALTNLDVECPSCAENSCCAAIEGCGAECAACLDDTASCANQTAAEQAAAVVDCLGGACGAPCSLTEICDSGVFAPNVDCAECLSNSCCMVMTTCAEDPDCRACLRGDTAACDATMNDELANDCSATNCAATCQ